MNILLQLPDSVAVLIDRIVEQNRGQAPTGLATEQQTAESLRIARTQGVHAANQYLREVALEHKRNAPPRSRAAVLRMLVMVGLNCFGLTEALNKEKALQPAAKEKPRATTTIAPWGVKPRTPRRKAAPPDAASV